MFDEASIFRVLDQQQHSTAPPASTSDPYALCGETSNYIAQIQQVIRTKGAKLSTEDARLIDQWASHAQDLLGGIPGRLDAERTALR